MRTASKSTKIVVVCLALSVLGALGCATHTAPPANDAAGVPSTVMVAALAPAPPPEPTSEYRIQSGDELHVRFTYQPELNDQIPVRPDGRISLATTGQIIAVGLTPAELEKLVETKSSGRLRNPEVVVVVTKIAEQRVYVGGEVRKPGYVTLLPGMTPLQAVVQTGGFRETAKLDSVLLLTPGAGNKFTAARMDMEQVVEDGIPERVRLHPGDVVYVPPTWIADMDIVVDQYVRGLIPALPRVGVGYSLSQ
jgi:protein involved in polysaccharide export with SLBB domain